MILEMISVAKNCSLVNSIKKLPNMKTLNSCVKLIILLNLDVIL